MGDESLNSIRAIYDERSEGYDNSFHTRQAQEYIEHAKLREGETVLDLACGTGLVTILAKRQVGNGRVVGVDISSGMLEVARRKTRQEGLDITYIEHDIRDLEDLDLSPKVAQRFDVITCASALLLLKDPLQALKHWASLLAPNGRLLTDVLVERSMIPGLILTKIGPEVGRPMPWNASWVKSGESLRELLKDAGLIVERVYKSEVFETLEHEAENGPEIFEKTVANPMFWTFRDPAVKEEAKKLFTEQLRDMVGENGSIREEVRFYLGIARKQVDR